MRIFAAVLLSLCFAAAASAERYTAKVIAVIDGDTVMVLRDNKKTTIRLAGIDAPEKAQPFGPASRAALLSLVLRKDVWVNTRAVDEYGRTVAILEVGRINVNEEQLRRGMAWEYSHYHSDKALIALQAEAQRARAGLWVQAQPQPPWEYRKAYSHAKAPASGVAATNSACGKKRYCSQMLSCEEATFYFTQCRVKTLDKNGDGVPCENLCKAKAP